GALQLHGLPHHRRARRRHPAAVRGSAHDGATEPHRRGPEGPGELAVQLPEGTDADSPLAPDPHAHVPARQRGRDDPGALLRGDGPRPGALRPHRQGDAPARVRRRRQAARVQGLPVLLLVPHPRLAEPGGFTRQLGAEPRHGREPALSRLDRQVDPRSPEAAAGDEDAVVLRRSRQSQRAAGHPGRQRRRADPGSARLRDLARPARDARSAGCQAGRRDGRGSGRPGGGRGGRGSPCHAVASIDVHHPTETEGGSAMRSSILVTGLGLAVLIGAGARAPELWAYEATTVTDGGTLSGTVKYSGTAPAPEKFDVTKDNEVCGQEKTKNDLVVGSGGGIRDVMVVVKAAKGKALEVPAQPVTFDQK